MVILVPPVLVMVPGNVCLLPTVTLPKGSLEGFEVSCPVATPVPDSEMVSVEFGASEVIVTFPLALPDN